MVFLRWFVRCFLGPWRKKEKQEGSTLTRPTDHSCSAKPLFMGLTWILGNKALGVFSVKMR